MTDFPTKNLTRAVWLLVEDVSHGPSFVIVTEPL